MLLPNLRDPMDRFLFASGMVSVIDLTGRTTRDAFGVVREHVQPPVTDWEEVNRAIAGVPVRERAQVVSSELDRIEAETDKYAEESAEMVDRARSLVSKGQFLAAVMFITATVLGFTLLMHGLGLATAALFALMYAVEFWLFFRLPIMARRLSSE
jgi:hypothetical protein